MRNVIKIAAIAATLLGSIAVAEAQSGQQGSTEAGTSYAQGHGGYGYYGGARAQYRGYNHRHYR